MNYTMNDICDTRDHPAARRKFIFQFTNHRLRIDIDIGVFR